jgi:hypothetical protein
LDQARQHLEDGLTFKSTDLGYVAQRLEALTPAGDVAIDAELGRGQSGVIEPGGDVGLGVAIAHAAVLTVSASL